VNALGGLVSTRADCHFVSDRCVGAAVLPVTGDIGVRSETACEGHHSEDGLVGDFLEVSKTAISKTAVGSVGAIALAMLALAGASHARADEAMQGLDEQVQEIKSDVLAIANELRQLEEKLLYPSDTQVSVFVALAEGDAVELDSVRIQIDGEPVAYHIYSFKELEALRKGGLQRIYTGNVLIGRHQIEVSMAGKLAGGSAFDETQNFAFEKSVEPKVVGVTLAAQTVGGAQIELGDW
jgi:hypothetical protein